MSPDIDDVPMSLTAKCVLRVLLMRFSSSLGRLGRATAAAREEAQAALGAGEREQEEEVKRIGQRPKVSDDDEDDDLDSSLKERKKDTRR